MFVESVEFEGDVVLAPELVELLGLVLLGLVLELLVAVVEVDELSVLLPDGVLIVLVPLLVLLSLVRERVLREHPVPSTSSAAAAKIALPYPLVVIFIFLVRSPGMAGHPES